MTKRQDIQVLRGVAVLMVVLYHLQVQAFRNGFLGVDVFFVISGHLMALLYDRGTPGDFYRGRFMRLFPACVAVVLVTLAFSLFILVPGDFSQLVEQAFFGVAFASNIYYSTQVGYFSRTDFNPLLNLWSLGVEMQFYLLVPILYAALRRTAWLLVAAFCASFFLCVGMLYMAPKLSFYMMPPRIWEFLAGAYVAWLHPPTIGDGRRKAFVQWFLLAALLALVLFTPLVTNHPSVLLAGHPAFSALLVVVVTGLILHHELPPALLRSIPGRALAITGDYSYSIYLVHFPVIVLVLYRPLSGTILAPQGTGELFVICAATALLSLASYHLVERRVQQTRRVGTMAGLALCVCLATVPVDHFNLNRMTEHHRNIYGARTDRDAYRCGRLFRLLNPTKSVCALTVVEGSKRILLLGNSHAHVIKSIFSDVAKQHGFSTYFIADNEPLLQRTLDARRVWALARTEKIDFIVIHYSNVYGSDRFREQLLTLIELAADAGIKSVIFAPVPTYRIGVPRAMYEDVHGLNDFSVDLRTHLANTEDYVRFSASLARLNVATYDPADMLCSADTRCRFSNAASKPFYFDHGHLTLTGAAELRPLFERSIAALE